jgi:hypothetical protein
MQLFKSLFCFRGCDKPLRFALINLALYLLLLLTTALFARHSIPLLILLLMALLPVAVATAIRRIRDAGAQPGWAAAPAIIFVLCTITITQFDSIAVWLSLLLPLLSTLVLARYPAKQPLAYIMGYQGPVDLSELTPNHSLGDRVEPTLSASGISETHPVIPPTNNISSTANANPLPGLEALKLWIGHHQGISFAIVLAFTALLMLISMSAAMGPLRLDDEISTTTVAPAAITTQLRQHPLDMPGDYQLMQNPYQGVIIRWPSYDDNNAELWSIVTAKGEPSCQQALFNGDKGFRTLKVTIEDDGDYYASFSPLDSAALITAIADRRSFSLCGYEFSLKGSRAALNRSTVFLAYLL